MIPFEHLRAVPGNLLKCVGTIITVKRKLCILVFLNFRRKKLMLNRNEYLITCSSFRRFWILIKRSKFCLQTANSAVPHLDTSAEADLESPEISVVTVSSSSSSSAELQEGSGDDPPDPLPNSKILVSI